MLVKVAPELQFLIKNQLSDCLKSRCQQRKYNMSQTNAVDQQRLVVHVRDQLILLLQNNYIHILGEKKAPYVQISNNVFGTN